MEAVKEICFAQQPLRKRLRSMLKVDLRRLFTTRLFFIMVGICLVMPILILVMTTMMDGSVTVDPQTGKETVIEGFDNTWQAIGTLSSDGAAMSMDLTGMCNINMLYFFVAVFVCLFVSEDFRSGYAKNLFTVRAKKTDYVISKTLVGFVSGVCMLLAFFGGTVIGGAVAGLPFDTGAAGVTGLILCMLAKVCLLGVFVPIYLTMSVVVKQKAWLSMCLSLGTGMLLFMMVPALTPLDATVINVLMCLTGGVLFSAGLGAVSNAVLKKTSLV